MGIGEAAFSPGDLMRRVKALEDKLREATAARRLENAAIGAGGITITDSGAIEIFDADRTRKLMIRDGLMRFFPDLIGAPGSYFYVWTALSVAHAFQIGYVQAETGNDFGFGQPFGGQIDLDTGSAQLTARPDIDGQGEDQNLYLGAVGGWSGQGTIGNLAHPAAVWITDTVTGLSSGTTVIDYGQTFITVPRPLVTLKAPAAVAWAVTDYTDSGFTINVAAGPAAGTVEVMYWAIRPTIP